VGVTTRRAGYHAEAAREPDLVPATRRSRPPCGDLGAHREAVCPVRAALRSPPDDRDLAELYDGYADVLAMVDRWPAAAQARQKAIRIWHELGE
jgi:hypothetical protein